MTNKITTVIFDVDDTLYDIGSGFTEHRNGNAVQRYMVEELGFMTLEDAKEVRDEYFERYHSTGKALTIAQAEGRFPEGARKFDVKDLSEWWAKKLDYSLLGGKNTKLIKDLEEIPLRIVAFSNGPRKYVKRCLQELGVWDYFGEDSLFALDDVLPYCKPEKEAFESIFERVGVKAEECIMVEDSMKNIRKAKELGMKTVLIMGRQTEDKAIAKQTNSGDAPVGSDPAVDVAVETINDMRNVLPGLWESNPAQF